MKVLSQQEVLCLDVSVSYVSRVDEINALKQIPEEDPGYCLGKTMSLLYKAIQLAMLLNGHHKVRSTSQASLRKSDLAVEVEVQ